MYLWVYLLCVCVPVLTRQPVRPAQCHCGNLNLTFSVPATLPCPNSNFLHQNINWTFIPRFISLIWGRRYEGCQANKGLNRHYPVVVLCNEQDGTTLSHQPQYFLSLPNYFIFQFHNCLYFIYASGKQPNPLGSGAKQEMATLDNFDLIYRTDSYENLFVGGRLWLVNYFTVHKEITFYWPGEDVSWCGQPPKTPCIIHQTMYQIDTQSP